MGIIAILYCILSESLGMGHLYTSTPSLQDHSLRYFYELCDMRRDIQILLFGYRFFLSTQEVWTCESMRDTAVTDYP